MYEFLDKAEAIDDISQSLQSLFRDLPERLDQNIAIEVSQKLVDIISYCEAIRDTMQEHADFKFRVGDKVTGDRVWAGTVANRLIDGATGEFLYEVKHEGWDLTTLETENDLERA